MHLFTDIINKEGSYSSTVISGCNGTVSFLPSSVPNLGLYCFPFHLNASCSKLHTNCRFWLQIELISGKTWKQIWLSYARVSNKNDWKLTVIIFWNEFLLRNARKSNCAQNFSTLFHHKLTFEQIVVFFTHRGHAPATWRSTKCFQSHKAGRRPKNRCEWDRYRSGLEYFPNLLI